MAENLTESSSCDIEKLSILVIGKTGVGKSSFVNTFLRKKVALVKYGPRPTAHDIVEVHEGTLSEDRNGKKVIVHVVMYDTRGLCDPSIKEKVLLKAIAPYISSVDLVYLCMNMFDRFDDGILRTVKILNEKLGIQLWNHTVVVLTHADKYKEEFEFVNITSTAVGDQMTNVVQVTESMPCQGNIEEESITIPAAEQEMFKLEQEIIQVFAEASDKHGIPRSVINKIPVCPSSSKFFDLPGTSDWMAKLLDISIDCCRPHSRKHMSDLADIRKRSTEAGVELCRKFHVQIFGMPIGKILDFTFSKQCYE